MEQQKIQKKNMLTNEIKEFIQEMPKTSTIVEEQIRKHTGASNQSMVIKVAMKNIDLQNTFRKWKFSLKNWREIH